ncbi:probable protein S-acyltransferase 23 [Myzus persicae]|uniref:probable protein S-acyltransferase 23 n=1 Tax=Myzus persicae TaxID=13164 RepID=UPI000B936F79|nr:probable protein S-acyltransferase 23 [Myzus persicae]
MVSSGCSGSAGGNGNGNNNNNNNNNNVDDINVNNNNNNNDDGMHDGCSADSLDVHSSEDQRYKPLLEAIKTGDYDGFEFAVDKCGGEALSFRDEWGYTPAHWAALYGNAEVLRYLVARGVTVDMSCYGIQGSKPVHWACRKGHTAAVQVLLQAGVNPNVSDFKGLTPLMTASMFGKTSTASFLLGMGALHHLTDINGDTALHWASYKGHPELIRLLLYSGADLTKADNFGSTPLHLAALSGSAKCVEILCQNSQISLQPRDKNGKTPLGLAVNHRYEDIAGLLNREIKKRKKWMVPLHKALNAIFGSSAYSKGPLLLFLCSFLIWWYPLYIYRVVPATWNLTRGCHYTYLAWNIFMWICWITTKHSDPGFLPIDSGSYIQTIRQLPFYPCDMGTKRDILSRLCHTCRCVRPLRAKHCRLCNRCVQHFDHHCQFVINCIGLSNRSWFFWFVISLAMNCSYVIYLVCCTINVDGFNVFYVLALLQAFAFGVLSWALTATICINALMNLTRNEMINHKKYTYLKNSRGKYYNPFSRGIVINVLEFFGCTQNRNNYEGDIYNCSYD